MRTPAFLAAAERAEHAAREFAFGLAADGRDGIPVAPRSPELPQLRLIVGRTKSGEPRVRFWPEWEAA